MKRSDRSVYDKTTFWYCRANDTCVQQNVCYKMSTNSTSSASDHLKTYHHVVNNKVAMMIHQQDSSPDYGRGMCPKYIARLKLPLKHSNRSLDVAGNGKFEE